MSYVNKLSPDEINSLIDAFSGVFVTKADLDQQIKSVSAQIEASKADIISEIAGAISSSVIPTLEDHETRIQQLEITTSSA
jgi:hypothetical protein